MPYEWTRKPSSTDPNWRLSLWPYRSLLRKHFVAFMGATAGFTLLPLLALLGTGAVWFILPFVILVFSGLWYAIEISYDQGTVLEELHVDDTMAYLVRQSPRGDHQTWRANRYWVTIELHPKGGPVENYITLRGGDRTVELGAFLDVDERARLYSEIQGAFRGPI